MTEVKNEETKTTETKTTPKTTTRRTTKQPTQAQLKKELDELKSNVADMAKDMAKEIAKELLADQEKTYKEEIEELKKELATTKKETKTDNDELIPVRSITEGTLVYKTRDGLPYTWESFGSVHMIPYSDLRFMRNAHSNFLTNGLLIIDDESVAEELHLTQLYESLTALGDLDSILSLPADAMENAIKPLPKGLKDSLAHKATSMIRKKTYSDLNRIRALQETLGVDLEIYL